MAQLSLGGRVVRATDFAPLPNATVRLLGPAAALGSLPGSRPFQGQPFAWSRPLSGFKGTRWECWVAHVQGQVPGLTWAQFRDDALVYNPQLNADGRLFKDGKTYLIPQPSAGLRAALQATTDAAGAYAFNLGATPAACELQVEAPGYTRFALPVVVNGVLSQPVSLVPQSGARAEPGGPVLGASGSVRSARADYATLPAQARRVVDMALFMLGDDVAVFDALPAELRKLCYGARFLADPNHAHHKDIVCADLVSVAFKAAGLEIDWGGRAGPSMADYYLPDGNPRLLEISDPNDWLPGDLLLYGPSGTAGRTAGHVNLYVGGFVGTDRSGRTYGPADQAEVVDASMDFMSGGREIGTGVQGRPLRRYCLERKCYTYRWVRHVRLRELAAAFGR